MPKINSEGSIYQQKNGTWVASLVIGKNEKGKPKRKNFYGKSDAEVKKKLKAYKTEQAKHDYINVSKTDIASYLRSWLRNELSLSLKPKSYDTKEYIIEKLIIPAIGSYQVGDLTRDDIQSLISRLSQNYSYSTVRKVYDTLNQRFKKAILDREIIYNPATGVTLPRKTDNINNSEKEIRFFSEDELNKILAEAAAKYPNSKTGMPITRLGYAIHLLAYTGMRAGEALALTWDDIDFENKQITINKNSVNIKKRDGDDVAYTTIIQKSTKTKHGTRVIPMSKRAMEALTELQKITGKYEFVLSSSTGKHMSHRAFDKSFRGIQRRAGIEPLGSLHSLRHTFASRLIEKGVDIKIVSELLGHSDVSVTYNTYIHIIQKQKAQAINVLDDI